MIGMQFAPFLALAIISLIAALVLHYGAAYRFLNGFDGFVAKWIIAWVGGWLASPVLGTWFGPLRIDSVYIVPAFIGAFALAFACTAAWKARTKALMAAGPTEVNTNAQHSVAA
jgi:uncharacterized membrane protein YeaQ/YmgE (transglycosylase-associated protein family)